MQQGRASWLRRRWPLVALAIVLAAFAAAATWGRGRPSHPALVGAVVQPPLPAYDFHLTDQDGRSVSLSSLRGKPVALTFLYAHCPDVCPLIAEQFHETYQKLGDTARQVALVAVSVDPKGDTPAAVRDFLKTHHVVGELTYLTGSFKQLRDVWAHYEIGSDAQDIADINSPARVTQQQKQPDQVGHTAIVYVIDPQGRIEVFLPGNFDPEDLVTDLRILTPAVRH